MVIVAARGSDQNREQGEYLGPQQYAPGTSPSNGFEGRNLSGLFHLVEKRHPAAMESVYVLALDDTVYPATMELPALAQEGEELSPVRFVQRLGEILRQYPLPELVYSTAAGFIDSVRKGQENAPRAVDDYEASTGCTPSYITAGYSQGAIVTTSLEPHLEATGRLQGAMYLGNPLESVPSFVLPQQAEAPHRLNYCLHGDFTCDLNAESARAALSNRAALHASYFQGEPSADDAQVADELAGWIKEAKAY